MKLSILIPSLESRSESLDNLKAVIKHQMDVNGLTEDDIELIAYPDNGGLSIGYKRNLLLEKASGRYVCFIDDDDDVSVFYLKSIFEGIEKDVDCCSLRGIITWDGGNPQLFEHSIKYDSYKTNNTGLIRYERYPNHLNCIKASIAKQFKFPETNHGEDTDWAGQIFKSGLIKTEHYIDKVIYHYQFKPTK